MQSNDLRDALTIALDDEPPVAHGPSDVFEQARRIGRRQRVTVALAGLTTVGLVLGGVAVGTGLVGNPGHAGAQSAGAHGTSNAAGHGSGAAGAPAAIKPSASPSQGNPLAGNLPATGVLTTLKSLMPAGMTTSGYSSQPGYGGLTLKDKLGKIHVEINVQSWVIPVTSANSKALAAGDNVLDLYVCAKRSDPAGTTCHASTLPDGTRVLTADGPNEDPRAPQVRERTVDTLTTDGLRVVIVEWNAVNDKVGPVTRPNLTLSLGQLKTIALDPVWQ